MTTSFWRKAVALPLAWVMTVTSMLWAAPPTTVFASSTERAPNPVPYVYVEPPLLTLARAFEEALAAELLAPPLPRLPSRIAAFAFGATSFTRAPYTKVVQGSANFLYESSRGYGYTDVDGLDDTPNNRGVFSGPAEIYDQLTGAKPAGSDIVFRINVPNGTYRFVAAGGDPKYGDHLTTVRVRDGGSGLAVHLVENFRNLNREFWRVGFDGNLPPSEGALFAPLVSSPTLTVTSGFIEVHQIAGTGPGVNAGGDLNLIELWLVEEPVAAAPPEGLVRAFAFGADSYTRSYYTKIVQGGANFLYSDLRGFGYSDVSGLDTSPNNRGYLSGDAELYDQFIGAKPGGAKIVFKVKVPNGHYRLVLAGGDVEFDDHETTILARDGSDGKTTTLVDGLANPMNEFYRLGFEGREPPFTNAVNFLPLSTSPVIEITKGFLEIHQIAGASAGAGGDLSVLEIWQVTPVPPPEGFVNAFAFGADSYTRSPYTKVVQDGLNFLYDPARGYGYTNLSGLDASPNNRGILPADDEIYDQFIGAKPGGTSIVFRVDVPPGDYRFVAAGGDVQHKNHKTTVRVRDGSSGSFVSLVEDLENPTNEFYRVGFGDEHAPSAASVNFLPETGSPTLTVTSGYLEVHQIAGAGFAAGGDLSIFEIWRAGTVVPPSVAIESPLDGAFFTTSEVPVRVTFTGGSVLVAIDGTDRASELVLSPGVLEGTLTLGDGDHRIDAGAAAHEFTVDTEAPVLTIDPPAPYVPATPLVVTGTVSDRDPATVVDCPSATLEAGRFTCTFPLDEGSNALTVRASDRGGRETTASASVTLDIEAPEITILSPTPDTYTMASSIDVNGGVFDDSPVTVRVDSVDAVVNGNNFAATGVPVGTASNPIRVVATDAAGNVKEATVTVLFDAEPPIVTLSSPVDGAILPSPVPVAGTVDDTAPVILVDVNGQPVMVTNGSFTTTIAALDGPLGIVATAQDAAGNPGTAEVAVTVDSTAPDVSVDSPLDGAVTNATPISIQGTVDDDTAVSLTLNGTPKGSDFPIEAPLTKGANLLEIVATDAAGNSSSVSLGVVLDTDAPELLIVSPSEGELLVSLPVLVQGTVQDETAVSVVVNGVPAIRTGNAWQVAFDSLSEETHGFTAVATDAAGNSTTSTVSATLDTTPPVVSITTPATGFLTREATVDVTGTVEGAGSVTVNGVPATVTGGVFFALVALGDGDNPLRAVATDAAGRSTESVVVVVTQDAIPPTLDLVAPETLSGITSGKVLASASDNLALAEVILRVNGETRGVFTGPPFEIDLVLPDGAQPGDTLVVSAEASDAAGNRATSSRGVIVIEDGVIAGQVLDDKTSLPIEGASVTMGSRTVPTGARGQYSLSTGDANVVIRIDKPGMTSVERRTSVLADVGTVPVDARLTPLTGDRTEISPQGLPALLPLGWSPLSAFQVTTPAIVTLPEDTYLAQYRFSLHEWVMLSLSGPLDFEVPEAGSYAVVVPDTGVSVPTPGEILEGVDVQILPASVTTESRVEPAVLPPSGGVAVGSLSVFSPVPLPSGTVIQAEITETFTLASGDVASEETRYEDIVLFGTADGSLAATFPITSSLSSGLEDLVSGEVNLDLLAGREAVRGVRGGSRALTVEQGDFRLSVPGSSLPEDTAISLRTFDSTSFDTLSEVFVDLSGQVLSMGAELSMAADGLSPDDVYILARIARIDLMGGVPRMEFVSLATLAGERLSAPGVRTQGSYVFYRSFSPVGFVAGLASAPGAVVETSGLPFVALSDANGRYRAVALTGPVTVTAFVPRSSLRASASVDVLEGETAPLDLTLSGQLTTASVTPSDGALGVSISAQIDVASSTPLAQGPSLSLLEGGVGVPVRLVLSGSGRSLAVIPEVSLKHETTYTLEAATLADVFGGAVVIPQTTFTTGSKEALSADAEDVKLSLPGDNGIVEVSAFGLPPGTTVLLVNSGNGIVVSFTYAVDGVLGELPASISDRILVTLTDPAGSIVTFEKSKFVAPDGTTAIGPGGGTVEGPGGVELRIPEGALPQGVELKIRTVAASEFPANQRPELPGATLASGLEVQAPSMPQFEKEVKLTFPKPANAPEGAFFYVYRKHETATGDVLWETIDHAFVEGDKVVTASLPFAGLVATYAAVSLFVVAWTYAAARLDRATTGIVTGKVLRTVLQPNGAPPKFERIPNVRVSSGAGNAFSQEQDGTYTLFDETFRDGIVTVSATVEGVTQQATAYAINVEDDGPSQLRFYENIATANLTFPPIAPRPPPSAVGVVIFKKNPDGSRERTDGLVVESDTLVIGFTTQDTIQQARINGEVFNVRRELDTGVDWVLDQDFTPGRPGTFLIETTALGVDGSIANVAVTFRAIASGGSNNDTLSDEAPSVITLKTVPRNDAAGVPVDIFPQVTFTEPVVNVPGNVNLVDSDGQPVGFVLSGVGPDGPIADVSSAGAKLTSLTLQPMTGLKFGKRYTLSLSAGIEDLDEDSTGALAPKNLVPFSSSFTTFGPESLGGTDDKFGSAGIVVLEDRAFLVENNFFNGVLRAFDITDPVEPQEIVEAQGSVDGRPVDLAGEPGIVVVATGPTNKSRPSTLYLFDVTSETESRWVGAASVASSAQDGFVQRVDMLDGLAYVLTGRRGVQVVNLQEAIDLFQFETKGEEFSPGYFSVRQKLNTAGQGFGQAAVRQPIPLPKDANRQWFQQDLSAARIQANIWVGTTGEAPLLLVDTATRTAQVAPVDLITGSAIELGQVRGRDLALIAGWGSVGAEPPGWAFAVVDLSQPDNPFTLAIISLPLETQPTDILLTEDVAIVASENEAALVNLADPAHPLFAGTIEMVGGVLALSDFGVILSSARSAFGGDTENGGVNTATLTPMTVITDVVESPVIVTLDRKSIEPQTIKYRAIFPREDIKTSELEILRNGAVQQTIAVELDDHGQGEFTLPEGTEYPAGARVEVRLVVNRGEPERPRPSERVLPSEQFEVFPQEPLEWSYVDDPLDVASISTALIGRLQEERDTPVPPLNLHWHAEGAQPGDLVPDKEASPTGIYSTDFRPSRGAGTVQFVELRDEKNRVLGRTGPITALPGNVDLARLNPGPTQPVKLPADGKSIVSLALDPVRDHHGNLLPDGSRVLWSLVEGDGEVLDLETQLFGGSTSTRYQAGIEIQPATIRAEIRGRNEDAEHFLAVEHVPLQVTITRGERVGFLTNLEVEVTSDVGPPADETQVLWGANQGSVTFETTLTGGRSSAIYSTPVRKDLVFFPMTGIFATVGRSKGFLNGFPSSFESGQEPDVTLDHYRIIGDNPSGVSDDFPGQTIAHYRGGVPGETITLELGTARFPAVQPFAAYSLDLMDSGTAADAFGDPQLTASVHPSVSLETAEPVSGDGFFRFSGAGGLSILHSPLLETIRDFGFNGFVRFASLGDGQKILEKEGSYGFQLAENGGAFKLEFFVISGGVRKTVLSSQALAAATWYHFSAHLKSSRLTLSVGESAIVDTADFADSIDITPNPLTIGSSLRGDLDQVEFYDFTRSPLVAFSNGQTSIQLTLDAQGEAETTVAATGILADAASGGQPPPAVPVWRSSSASDPRNESYSGWLVVHTDASFRNCTDAIVTGENATGQGIGCDISAGLIPWVAIGQAFRDVIRQSSNYVEGKQVHYASGAFGVLILAANRIPILRVVRTGLLRGRATFKGLYIETHLAAEALRLTKQASQTGVAKLEGIAEVAGRAGGDAALDGLQVIAKGIQSAKTLSAVESLGQKYGANGLDRVLTLLGRVATDHALDGRNIARLIRYLDTIPFGTLTDDAVEGMAIFMTRVIGPRPFQGLTRVPNIIEDIVTLAPPQKQTQVANELFSWIKQGEKAFAGKGTEAAWEVFLRKGPGTLPGVSTSGNYHVLDYMANVVGFNAVQGLEVKVAGRFFDLLVEKQIRTGVTALVKVELKNLRAFSGFGFGNQVVKDMNGALTRAGFVLGGRHSTKDLIFELERIEYVLRGTRQEMGQVIQGIEVTMEKILAKHGLQHLLPNVRITPLGLGLPF